ncbi:M48 family metallopeptidase [Patescibacteria group bacterium]|nr:M48 family metallopeptidase [Patescibacteria group bacterium]
MTLYQQADSNVRKTWLLVTFFLVLVIGLGWLFSYILESSLILVIAVVFSVLMSFSSYWFSDKLVLRTTKAHPIEKKDHPELYRIVENLCLTAGLPLPKIFILPESQPNAFATGRNAKHAVVAVTQGLLDKLERVELEGVIAHELSHIGNKDMLLQTMIVILAGTIALLSNFFLRISFFRRGGNRRNEGKLGVLILILGLLAAILAPLAASLIRMAVSRKREFLADASGALLTRYPEGLAQALEKISKDQAPLRTASKANAHLFIHSPLRGPENKNWFAKLFMTHPEVGERIRALRGMKI